MINMIMEMINIADFKKYNLWTLDEDNIIKDNFYIKRFSSYDGSRFDFISEKLKEKGFIRSNNAISRRSYRLGCRSYKPKLKEKEVICQECKQTYFKYEKFINRDNKNICFKCQKKTDKEKNKEHYKEYHKLYFRTWRKNKKIKEVDNNEAKTNTQTP